MGSNAGLTRGELHHTQTPTLDRSAVQTKLADQLTLSQPGGDCPLGFSDLPTALELRIGSEGFFVVNSFERKFKDSLFVSNIIQVKSFENRYSKYIA